MTLTDRVLAVVGAGPARIARVYRALADVLHRRRQDCARSGTGWDQIREGCMSDPIDPEAAVLVGSILAVVLIVSIIALVSWAVS